MTTTVKATLKDRPSDYSKIQAITDCHAALAQLATEVIFGVETDEVSDVRNALEELNWTLMHLRTVFERDPQPKIQSKATAKEGR